MNWLFSLMVFQYTILLLHGRPDISSTLAPEKITLEMEHPSSVPAVITSLGIETSPGMTNTEIKKHLSTTLAVSPPSQTTKRMLSTVKKIDPTKKATNKPELVTFSTAIPSMEAIIKTTRYQDVDNRTKENMHAKQFTANHSKRNNNKSHVQPTSLYNTTHLRNLKQQYVNRLNRQYLGNIYNYNPYLAQVMTTPKAFQAIVAPPPQQTYFIVNSDDIGALDAIQTNGNLGNFVNVGNLGHIFNVDNPLNANFQSSLTASDTYQQVPRPPPLTVNIPYHEFPTPSPPLLYNSANITKLYSIIGSSTPDPYNNYEQVQTKPSLVRKKVVKFSVTTHRPYKHNNKNGNGHYSNKYSNKPHNNHNTDEFNQSNENHHHSGSEQFNSNESNVNKISIVYNESSQLYHTHNNDNNKHVINIGGNGSKFKNESLSQSTPKECLVTSNTQNENVCNSNDLKITIKIDGNNLNNATNKNEVIAKQKKKKLTTTTTTTTSVPFYDDLSYESDETKEESDELSSFLEPIQNLFGFFTPASRSRRRQRKGQNNKGGHKDKSGEIVNKYQTIILQTPEPPKKDHSKKDVKSLIYKVLALLPIFAILKPLGFGIWTLALSPLLVVVIGGVALGVILYPFLAISRKQIYYASANRSPKIVIHKHPRPIHSKPIYNPVQSKPSNPTYGDPSYTVAKWNAPERRRYSIIPNSNSHSRKMFYNNRQQNRMIPIHLRKLQERSKRRARDTQFQQWLLIQNNFNIRIMSPNQDYDYFMD